MDWSKGFTSKYILTLVDPTSWSDTQEYEFISGKIDMDADSSLLQSASIKMDQIISDGENYIRIYLMAKQNGDAAKVPLFTGLTASPERKINGTMEEYTIDAYSVLKPANDVILQRGYYIARGSGANEVKNLLSVCNAPIIVTEDSPVISEDVVVDDGTTKLDAANYILNSINWRLVIAGDGTIYICPKADSVSITFGDIENDCIETSVTDEYDWYSAPNVYMAVSDDYGVFIARDDDPDSFLSTVSRGREIWVYDANVSLQSGENIGDYAYRMLKESQSIVRTVKYKRRFFPEIYPTDYIYLNYPGVDISGTFYITSQSYNLEYGCTVSEEAVYIE